MLRAPSRPTLQAINWTVAMKSVVIVAQQISPAAISNIKNGTMKTIVKMIDILYWVFVCVNVERVAPWPSLILHIRFIVD